MPSTLVRLPSSPSQNDEPPNPLPPLLQTPTGKAIVEIQGTIHGPFLHTTETEGRRDDVATTTPVGRLEFPLYNPQEPGEGKWMKKVYLYIGPHQRLTGEIKRLAKPLAILRKARHEHRPSHASTQPASADDLELVEVVKFKLLFSARPEPVGEQS